MTEAPTTFAEAENVLAERLPGYESRPQQQALAAAVENVLNNGGQGLFEAGCGTGKSLGAMIPAILSGQRTVVATVTIALMEQYANKDVPFLQENLGVPFTWALLKGRSNYFCYAKAVNADRSRVPFDISVLEAELEANPEHSGDREHFATPVPKDQFSYVSSTSTECPGKRECPFGDVCKAEMAKSLAADAQVVVTNTAMLMTDLKVRQATDGFASMLGEYDALIVDEAHELEEAATNALEETLRPSGIEKLVTEARNFAATQSKQIEDEANAVTAALAAAWEVLPEPEKGQDKQRVRLDWFVTNSEPFMALFEALNDLSTALRTMTILRDTKKAEARRSILARRATNYIRTLGAATTQDDDHLVRWIEVEQQKRNTIKVIKTSPVRVGPFLKAMVWDNTPAALISATLSVSGKFDYIADRLGLVDPQTINVGTPFDYSKQALLFVPAADMPAPTGATRSAWLNYSANITMDLIREAGGGALLLFTSRSSLSNSFETLAPRLREMGFRPIRQGGDDGSNKEIARIFQEDKHSVLFATKSFFTGVDFAGDTCRLVVIDKLPFPVPTEPVMQARSEQVEREGHSSFGFFTVPGMTLTLNQGFGRLIRTKNDRGVVAILDSRLTSKGYGKQIVRALPDSPATTTLDRVESFYEG